MGRVSVIVPIYNAEKTLDKCIRSILKQTFGDFELILVNDGSTDNSLSVCEKYKQKDSRILVIDKKNEGSIATRRKGVECSNSNNIMFVDADDWIDKQMIETLYNELISNNLDIVVCNSFDVFGNGHIIKRKYDSYFFNREKIYNNEEIKREIVPSYFHYGNAFPASLWGKLYRKELLIDGGRFLERIHFFGDDLFYNLEILMKAKRVKIIEAPLYYYRMGGFTNSYMPYYFDDVFNGYQIQKEIINEYYLETKQEQYNGISIMLLYLFRNGLYNFFYGNLDETNIKSLIGEYVSNRNVIESLNNVGSQENFSIDYINAIRNQDIDFLYSIGENMFKRKRTKRAIKSFLTKLSFV
ncbi:glycosyltransferase family 2 protein [Lederbergia citrea]|uniref:Glycosyltransferase n=1 Tax=Lederbergia citrea TaxID=2833581 RepID=A0A942UNT5_9BACI|nr:glycosyltransferase [Lederbergia citrea]MBS4205796.1 glycosyltransferase [Lederbergia citrea]MBS4224755.1 glycosyltransferase [Lederbergia citrea]